MPRLRRRCRTPPSLGLRPDALELEQVWSPRVRTTPGEKRSCPGTYARLSPRRPCNECGPPRCFDECSDRQVSCGSPDPLVPRAKTHGFATVEDLPTIRLPARGVRLQRRPCVGACGEKPVLMETAGLVPRVFRLLALDRGLVFTTYSRSSLLTRRSLVERAQRAGAGRVSWTHRRSLRHSSGSSSQLRGALSAWLWKREDLETRRRRGRRTHKAGALPSR